MRALLCLAFVAAACGTYHQHAPSGPPVGGDAGASNGADGGSGDDGGVAPPDAPPLGATPYPGGVTFRLWAPHAQQVFVVGDFNQWSATANPLASEGNGIFGGNVDGAMAGQQYA